MFRNEYDKRQKKIRELAIPFLEEKLRENEGQILKYSLDEKKRKELISGFDVLFQKGIEAQKNKEKEKVAYIVIHFFRSSIMTKSFECEITLYDDQFYYDTKEISQIWSPDWIIPFYEKDIEDLERYLKKNILRLHNGELTEVEMYYGGDYFQYLIEMFQNVVLEVTGLNSYKELQKEDNCKILLGEIYQNYLILFDDSVEEEV